MSSKDKRLPAVPLVVNMSGSSPPPPNGAGFHIRIKDMTGKGGPKKHVTLRAKETDTVWKVFCSDQKDLERKSLGDLYYVQGYNKNDIEQYVKSNILPLSDYKDQKLLEVSMHGSDVLVFDFDVHGKHDPPLKEIVKAHNTKLIAAAHLTEQTISTLPPDSIRPAQIESLFTSILKNDDS